MAGTNRSRTLLQHGEGNSLVQVLREPTGKGAPLGLLFVNREGLAGKVAIGGRLDHSHHQAAEFQVVGDRRKTASKTSTLDLGRADFGLPEELARKGPGETCFSRYWAP